MSRAIRSVSVAATAVLGLSLIAVPQTALGAPPGPVTVASGLDNPRQLSVRPGQRLYVAEAGSGEACSPIPGVDPEVGVEYCGLTGAITEVGNGNQRRVVTRLPAMAANGEVVGASDVDVRGANITVLIGGMGGAASLRDGLGADYAAFGTLRTGVLRSAPIGLGNLALAADLNAWEVATNPDGKEPPDSNAVGFDALDSKNWAVTDAGGNSLLTVGKRGANTLSVFPDGPAVQNPFAPPGVLINPEAVPTDVVIGPDGAFYVSQLTGFPFPTGASTIWRVTRGGQRTVYATGLTTVTSLAWRGNTLYAVQFDDSDFFGPPVGSLRKVTPGGSVHAAVVDGLPAPYGLAIRGNSAFVTVNSTSTGNGMVLEVNLRA